MVTFWIIKSDTCFSYHQIKFIVKDFGSKIEYFINDYCCSARKNKYSSKIISFMLNALSFVASK